MSLEPPQFNIPLTPDARMTQQTYVMLQSYYDALVALTAAGGGDVDAAAEGGGGSWGSISGTLSDQTDLQSALGGKADSLGADDNYVTDAEVTKLTGIEASATADQTGAEIKVAYEAEADTNAYTDAEKVIVGNTSGTNTGDQTIPVSTVDFDPVGTDNSDNNAVNTLYSGLVSYTDADAVALNTAKVTNATHTGDVTGATSLTIAAGAVDIAMLSATGTADATTYLRGDNTWATPASGTAAPYAHLIISSTQNMGGSNGTVHYVLWDGTAINVDAGFTHSTVTNPSRVQVDANGRYEIKANVSIAQGGGSRTTFMSGLRVNGSTVNVRGRQRNYSRGSSYGDASTGLNTEIDLLDGDYLEMSITVDDTDGSYTSNAVVSECEFIIRKVA